MKPTAAKILVTGGAGFIGSAIIRLLLDSTSSRVMNVDKLGYASSLESLADYQNRPSYRFEKTNICDTAMLRALFAEFSPDAVIHLAAESHVDRSIDQPADFMQSNVMGTYSLLECCREYWQALDADAQANFRLLHVSTDEVFGDLPCPGDEAYDPAMVFTENTAYRPNNPYSASKAASDHLVRAWHRTYGLPVLVTHSCNNYGPFQFPEKLIPVVIDRALRRQPIPIYGSGQQYRSWLHVDDHTQALYQVLTQGRIGETYNMGGGNEIKNIDLVKRICAVLDQRIPAAQPYAELIQYVSDRPGHDRRYALDNTKMSTELGWQPKVDFVDGLSSTVDWYLQHPQWFERAGG